VIEVGGRRRNQPARPDAIIESDLRAATDGGTDLEWALFVDGRTDTDSHPAGVALRLPRRDALRQRDLGRDPSPHPLFG
jgi:hypothetical protein